MAALVWAPIVVTKRFITWIDHLVSLFSDTMMQVILSVPKPCEDRISVAIILSNIFSITEVNG